MGLLDIFKGKLLDPTLPGCPRAAATSSPPRWTAVVKWGRKSSIWPMPFGTACCAIEFMAMTASHYDLARFGAEVLRFSPRQADLMFVAGTIVDKEGPVLKTIYDQMPEPKWVISMGVCASSGGFYRSYHVMQGIDEIIPVDVYVPGLPALAGSADGRGHEDPGEDQERRAGQGARRARTGWARRGDGRIDRRARRAAWAAGRRRARASRACRPAACLALRVLPSGARPTEASWLAPREDPRPPSGRSSAGRPRAARTSSATQVQARGRLPRRPRHHGRRARPGCEAATLLRDHPELDFKLFLDLCGVDYLERTRDPTASRSCSTLYSVTQKHHVRLKTSCARKSTRRRHAHRRLQGRELVRARGLGPLRHRVQGPPEPGPAS